MASAGCLTPLVMRTPSLAHSRPSPSACSTPSQCIVASSPLATASFRLSFASSFSTTSHRASLAPQRSVLPSASCESRGAERSNCRTPRSWNYRISSNFGAVNNYSVPVSCGGASDSRGGNSDEANGSLRAYSRRCANPGGFAAKDQRRVVRAAAGRRWFQGGRGRQNSRFGDGRDGGSDGGNTLWNYPWESDGGPAFELRRESFTFITSEGVFQIHEHRHVAASPPSPPSPSVPAPSASSRHRFSERRYMDPDQGLCLASLFDIRAFNGLDASRLFCVVGFCRSAEMLSDVVEDTVLMAGGEVVNSKLELGQGLHEHLRLTVALPFLFGVPPALDSLNRAIRLGGGIVDKSFHQWEMCQ